MPIRVFIYDDSSSHRESLKALIALNNNLLFVGEAATCKQVLQEMLECTPDIVLMDIRMPDVDGITGLGIIKLNHPNIQVLMQTAFDDDENIFNCIKNGASGYILKSDNANKILQAIEEVFAGGVVMNPTIAKKVIAFFQPKITTDYELTNKELEVLQNLADGMSYKMIANEMGISYATVNHHVKRIYAKLHISSLGEAIAFYYKNILK